MGKPRVVFVAPESRMFPFAVHEPAFHGLDVELVSVTCRTQADVLAAVRGADVVLLGGFPVDAGVVAAMAGAQALCIFSHGFEKVDVAAATRAGILVTNAARICHQEVANHAVAFLLALNRRIVQYDRAMRQGTWDRPAGRPIGTLDGEVAGLIGLGAIGQAIARRLAPFGLRLVAYDPYVERWVFGELGVRVAPDLPALLRESDYVSIQVPANAHTRHLMGEREFRAMKPSAYFVNCCRGEVVDEAALARALADGALAGAGLDVFEQEPTDPRNPLLAMPQVIATPHAAGESVRSGAESARVASEQAAAVVRGEWPSRVVNPEVWARLRQPRRPAS
jgi:D-3-phosphoglycerate dehydrogenase